MTELQEKHASKKEIKENIPINSKKQRVQIKESSTYLQPSTPPSPPPPPPVSLPNPSTMRFVPNSKPVTPLQGILKKSPSYPQLEDLTTNNTPPSSTSGYSTQTDATRRMENGTKGWDAPSRNSVSTPIYQSQNPTMSRIPQFPPSKKQFDKPPENKVPESKIKTNNYRSVFSENRSETGGKLKPSPMRAFPTKVAPAQTETAQVNVYPSTQKSIQDKLKRLAGKPKASWESQIDEIAADQGILFEKPLAYTDSTVSEHSGIL